MQRVQFVASRPGQDADWLAAFDALGVEFLILDIERDASLLQLVLSQPGWIAEFQDEEAALFARSEKPRDMRATV